MVRGAGLPLTSWERLRERTLSVAAIREVDRIAVEQFHMHPLVLMENAASGCARWLVERYPPRADAPMRACLLCGRGNNGGDGLALARHLQLAGWQCHVLVCGPLSKLSDDARANFQILTPRSAPTSTVITLVDPSSTATCEGTEPSQSSTVSRWFATADVIVDAMLGSGASGSPRAPFDRWIELANAAAAKRVAIDIPTGLDAETGEVASIAFQADATLTFVARKPGFRHAAAQAVLGAVEVIPIGIPVELIDELLAQSKSSAPGGGS